MEIKLSFSLGQRGQSSKVAIFPSIEKKQEYVVAECNDLRCQNAYYLYQAARDKEERNEKAKNLDIIRYEFFKRWRAKNLESEKQESNEPTTA